MTTWGKKMAILPRCQHYTIVCEVSLHPNNKRLQLAAIVPETKPVPKRLDNTDCNAWYNSPKVVCPAGKTQDYYLI